MIPKRLAIFWLVWLLGTFRSGAAADERTFSLNGVEVFLEDVSADVEVYFRSMRLIRAQNVWKSEVTLKNRSTRSFAAPLILSIESFTGTIGPLAVDGEAGTPPRSFFDLSSNLTASELAPGASTTMRTLQFGRSAGSPVITTRVFAARNLGGYALGYVRSLDAVGHPLANVSVEVRGLAASETNQTDSVSGFLTFGQGAGPERLVFRKDAYLPVWRETTLFRNTVSALSPPRLTERSVQIVTLTQNGGSFSSDDGGIQVRFGAGTFATPTDGSLTPLIAQSLPAFLPRGWTPLQAFWLETGREPIQAGESEVLLWESVKPTNELALVQWDVSAWQWKVASVQTGASDRFKATIRSSGAYAVVVGDSGTGAAPRPLVGLPLAASPALSANIGLVSASGILKPPTAAASREAVRVTTQAEVTFTNASGGLASGTIFRCEVQERYAMRDGTARITPRYEQDIIAYRPAGERSGARLQARFPLRPLLLLDAADLVEATVHVEVLFPAQFAGQIIDTGGGTLSSGDLSIEIAANEFLRTEAVELRNLDKESFASLLPDGTNVLHAFELRVPSMKSRIGLQVRGLAPDTFFVLGRVLSQDGGYGIEPVERLRSDNSGHLVSLEPASGDALNGMRTAGQYVLVRVAGAEALVTGTALNAAGQTTNKMFVAVDHWLALTSSDGKYRILVPAGTNTVTLWDGVTGERTISQVIVPSGGTAAQANLRISAVAPQVVSITPFSGATKVSRVAPVVLQFSEPIARESISTNEIKLIGPTNQVIAATVTLSLDNSVGRLLPTELLGPSTVYRVVVSDQVRDLSGARLAGAREFSFTTASDLLERPPGAQVISHEPVNGIARMEGTQGIADPESPVILLNDTTGQTGTTLSKVDGSFTGEINAAVEDRLRAVFVNQNGTRTEIPVGRQLFADGSVALFSGGGSLTNGNAELTVVLEIPPGATPGRTKFKLEALKTADLAAVSRNTPPQDATVFGLFDLKVEGDKLLAPAKFIFRPDLSKLVPPPGKTIADSTLVAAAPRAIEELGPDGPTNIVAYQILGQLKRDVPPNGGVPGSVRAQSFFDVYSVLFNPSSASVALFLAPQYSKTEISGLVQSALFLTANEVVEGTQIPLGGAVVRARAGEIDRAFTLQPGEAITVSDSLGSFSFMIPAQPQGGSALVATHPNFPRQFASTSGARFDPTQPYGGGFIIFDRKRPPDTSAPSLVVTHTPSLPQARERVFLRVQAADESGPPVPQLTLSSVDPLTAVVTLAPSNPPIWTLDCDRPAKVTLKASATDSFNNTRELVYAVLFGEPPSAPPTANDPAGPYVTSSQPDADGVQVSTLAPITLRFNKPVDIGIVNNPTTYLTLSPDAGRPSAEFGRDHHEVIIHFPKLANQIDYTLTVQAVRDLGGKVLDQNPDAASPPNEPFVLRFHTAPEIHATLPGIDEGKGVVMLGGYAYVIDRKQSTLDQFDISIPFQPIQVAQKSLTGAPWSLALIPDYSFVRTNLAFNNATPPPNPLRSDLLAVAGKTTRYNTTNNQAEAASYLRIFDLRQPLDTTAAIAGTVLSLDETALITSLVWSPPYLFAVENSVGAPAIHVINLQGLLLADYYSALPLKQLGLRLVFTNTPPVDANSDGDFVDPGDKLPLIGSDSLNFIPGEDALMSLAPNRDDLGPNIGFFPNLVNSSRFITAVVADGISGFVGALIAPGEDVVVDQFTSTTFTNKLSRPASFRSFLIGQSSPDTALLPSKPGARYVIEFPGWYPKQALLVNDGLSKLAVISLISLGLQTNSLRIIDVTQPDSLVELNEIPLPVAEFGLLQGAALDDQGRILLSTVETNGEHFILLDSKKLLLPAPAHGAHPAILGFNSSGGGSAGFASQRYGTTILSQRNNNTVTQVAPLLRLVNVGTNWFDPFGFSDLSERLTEIRALQDMRELPVARHPTNSNLIPPDPKFHWQLLLEAPGGAGTNINLAVMSVDAQGKVIPRINTIPPPSVLPSVPLRRLSDDLHSPAFNLYLSRPLVLVGEDIDPNEMARANSVLPRHILFAGERLSVGISEESPPNVVLGPFAGSGIVSPTPTPNAPPVRLGASITLPVLGNITPQLNADSPVVVKTHVDAANNTVCPGSAWIDYTHNINANISILVDGRPLENVQNESGNHFDVFTDVTLGAGHHRVLIDSSHVRLPGEHTFQVVATELNGQPPGTTLMADGIIQHEIEINQAYPIGHTIIQGVDIWDGHLTHSRQDVLVPGRRLSLDFSRSYSSQGNSSDGPMGAGWTHSYNIRVVEQCGIFTVIGGEGSGNAFSNPQVNPAMAARYAQFLPAVSQRYEFFQPQIGYHSTLVRDTGKPSELWFFTKAAVRYHFVAEPKLSPQGVTAFTLREIREPNGNEIVLDYLAADPDPATLDTVTERYGGIEKRGFHFQYRNIGGVSRLISLVGFNAQVPGNLLGLDIRYFYDQWGNLTNVVRQGSSPNDTRSESYAYTPGRGPTGHNLIAYTDPNGAVTTYGYGPFLAKGYYQLGIPLNDIPPHEMVTNVVRHGAARPGFAAATDSVTRFRYDLPAFQRFVTDPRTMDADGRPIPDTQYGVNSQGATTNIAAPLGQTTVMRWATDHLDGSVLDEGGRTNHDVLMTYKKDAEGQEHFYEYHDGRGNLTREIIRVSPGREPIYDAAGNRVSEVISTNSFDALFNAQTNHVDAEGNATITIIDPANGNLLSITDAEGNKTTIQYKANGEIEKRIDPRGFVSTFSRYDIYGNAEEVSMEVERNGRTVTTTSVYDERSRLLDTRDTFTHHSHFEYDNLDRRVREERLNNLSALAATGPNAIVLTAYLPGGEIGSTTNALGLVSLADYDALNRKVRSRQLNIQQATAGPVTYTNQIAYDEAGNVISEIDARGVVGTHFYDALNRRQRTEMSGPFGGPFKPDHVLSSFTYDRVNNLQTETDLHGFVTSAVQDGLYRTVETHLPFPNAIIRARYDRVGTKRWGTDANGNATEFSYDKVYRLTATKDPLGNESQFTYDRSGNRTNVVNVSSGLVTAITFDGLNRPLESTHTGPGLPAAGFTSTVTYSDLLNEVVSQNPRKFKNRVRKDGLDRVAESVVDDTGLNLTSRFTYDAAGNVLTLVDPQNGDVDAIHSYDELSRRIRTEYAAISPNEPPVFETVTYDPAGNANQTRDKRGFERRMAFDNLNRTRTNELKEVISNGGTWLTLNEAIYDDDRTNKVTTLDARRNPTITENDQLGRPAKINDALGHFVSMTYDGVNKLSSTDKKGQRAAFTYDALNRLITTTEFDTNNTARTGTTIAYLDRSRQQLVTDRRGFTNRTTVDALGRTILSERLGGDLLTRYGADPLPLTRQEYDGNNNVVTVTDADGRVTTHEYDGADRKIATTEGFGSTVAGLTTYKYNNVGNLLESKDARVHIAPFDIKNAYDARYRRISAANALGETSRFEYDAANNVTSTTEPLGFQTKYEYDELNALLSVDETPRASGGDAGVTRFRYDANRNKLAQQDASSNLVTYAYDALDRLTNTLQHLVVPPAIDPHSHRPVPSTGPTLEWTTGYDPNNNENRIVDARNQTVDLIYDHLNRLIARSYSRHAETNVGGLPIEFQVLEVKYAYDGNGNPTNCTEVKQGSAGVLTERTASEFDALDRLATKTRFDFDNAIGLRLRFEYDAAGNRTQVEDPDSRITRYGFDQRNRLSTVTMDPGIAALQARYHWEADGLLQRLDLPGGAFTAHRYDAADRLSSITNFSGSGAILSAFSYSYDANGNRTAQVESQVPISVAPETTTYGYDRLNRLTNVSYGVLSSLSFTYAPNGNRLTESGIDPISGAVVNRKWNYTEQSGKPGVTFSGVNTLTRIQDLTAAAADIDYEYDANLNQVARIQGGSTNLFRFDIGDQMIVAQTPAVFSRFDYNYDRLRVKKLVNIAGPGASPETRYLYDESAVLIEYGDLSSGHETQQKYEYGQMLLALGTPMVAGSLVRDFYQQDGLGSTAGLVSSAGAHTKSYRYDAWGRLRAEAGTSNNRREYTGHYKDIETGLHYFGARYYDDEEARFLSEDPYLGRAETPPSLHRYIYSYDNPLRYVDLTGYVPVPLQGGNGPDNALDVLTGLAKDDEELARTTEANEAYFRMGYWEKLKFDWSRRIEQKEKAAEEIWENHAPDWAKRGAKKAEEVRDAAKAIEETTYKNVHQSAAELSADAIRRANSAAERQRREIDKATESSAGPVFLQTHQEIKEKSGAVAERVAREAVKEVKKRVSAAADSVGGDLKNQAKTIIKDQGIKRVNEVIKRVEDAAKVKKKVEKVINQAKTSYQLGAQVDEGIKSTKDAANALKSGVTVVVNVIESAEKPGTTLRSVAKPSPKPPPAPAGEIP